MNCKDFEVMLPTYVDGGLDGDLADACRKHIDECADCRELAALYRMAAEYKPEEVPVPPYFRANVISALAAEKRRAAKNNFFSMGFSLRTVAATAAAAVLICAAVWLTPAKSAIAGMLNLSDIPALESQTAANDDDDSWRSVDVGRVIYSAPDSPIKFALDTKAGEGKILYFFKFKNSDKNGTTYAVSVGDDSGERVIYSGNDDCGVPVAVVENPEAKATVVRVAATKNGVRNDLFVMLPATDDPEASGRRLFRSEAPTLLGALRNASAAYSVIIIAPAKVEVSAGRISYEDKTAAETVKELAEGAYSLSDRVFVAE